MPRLLLRPPLSRMEPPLGLRSVGLDAPALGRMGPVPKVRLLSSMRPVPSSSSPHSTCATLTGSSCLFPSFTSSHQSLCFQPAVSPLSAFSDSHADAALHAGTQAVCLPKSCFFQSTHWSFFPLSFGQRKSFLQDKQLIHMLPTFFLSRPPKGFEKFFPSDNNPAPNATGSEGQQRASTDSKPPPSSDLFDSGGGSNNRNSFFGPRYLGNAVTMLLLGWGLWAYYASGWPSRRDREITMQEFLSRFVAKGFVDRIDIINKEYARVALKIDVSAEVLQETLSGKALPTGGHFCFRITSPEAFEHKLENFQQSIGLAPLEYLPVKHVQESDFISDVAPYFPVIALCLCSLLVLSRAASMAAAHNDPSKILRMKRANAVMGNDVKVLHACFDCFYAAYDAVVETFRLKWVLMMLPVCVTLKRK